MRISDWSSDVCSSDLLVQEGQVMLRMDDTSFASSRGELKVQELSLLGQMARLDAEISGAGEITFQDGLSEQATQVIRTQKELFQARQKGLENQLSIQRKPAEQPEQEPQKTQKKSNKIERRQQGKTTQ